jgi:peptidoglycan-associated lipoprotein
VSAAFGDDRGSGLRRDERGAGFGWIDGYTDSRGTSQYNLPLSQRPVTTVRDALIQAGVSADRIETGTFGTDRFVCNPSTEQCSQREGRVEVLVRAGY